MTSMSSDTCNVETCECGSTKFIKDTNRGEITCLTCGLVLADHVIDIGHDKKFFSTDEMNKRMHSGDPLRNLLPDKGLTTTIDRNTNLSPRKRQVFNRLTKIQNRSCWQERNLTIAMNEIRRLCSQLSLSYQISNASATLYRKIYKKDLVKGRSIKAMSLVSIYITCKQTGIPITLSEISNHSPETIKTIRRSYRIVMEVFNFKLNASSPVALISRIGGYLQVSNTVERDAVLLLQEVLKTRDFHGIDPRGVACASIYLSGLKNKTPYTQKALSIAGNVTEVTIRNRIKDLKKILIDKKE